MKNWKFADAPSKISITKSYFFYFFQIQNLQKLCYISIFIAAPFSFKFLKIKYCFRCLRGVFYHLRDVAFEFAFEFVFKFAFEFAFVIWFLFAVWFLFFFRFFFIFILFSLSKIF